MKKIFLSVVAIVMYLLSANNTQAQVSDPALGLRAAWMRGSYGLNWKPAKTDNGKSETDGLSIDAFLEQIKHLKTVDYIQVHLNESGGTNTVHLAPHGLIESFWQGDMNGASPINLAVPRASIGRDPLMEIMKAIKAAGLKVQVYTHTGSMLSNADGVVPDVATRWKAWCDTDSTAQAFIDSKSYHVNSDFPNRKYMFCYAEFILKEYAMRYGDLVDAWLFDASRTMWLEGGDFNAGDDVSNNVEEQRVYQAFADACHAGNPDAAIAFNNSPGANDFVHNPFTAATLFDDYMFGHPYSGGKNVGNVAQNLWALEWIAERDGYIFRNDPDNDRTWDDNIVGHWDPPMSVGQWNTGSAPGVADSLFAEYYGTAILGNGAVSFGIPLVGRYNFTPSSLTCRAWALNQLEMLDSLLLADQYAGAPVWARQETYLPPAYIGQAFSRDLVEGVDFWDPEGDEITDVLISPADSAPSWLSISETTPGTWILSGIPNETSYAEYEFSLRVKDASGASDRIVKLKVFDPDSIPVTGVLVSPSRASLCIDDTQTLATIVFPSEASVKSLSWRSSDTSVATVNASGLVTARDTGRVTITATTQDGACTDECVVSVVSKEIIPVSGVDISTDSVTLNIVGEKKFLNVTVLPSSATNQNLNWSSNNTSVATVNGNGQVTAIAAGNASIIVSSDDGGFTDTCFIHVVIDNVVGDYMAVEIKAAEDSIYGVDEVAVMVSETLTAPDGIATFQISIDVTPQPGKSIVSGISGGVSTTKSWGLTGDGRETTKDYLFFGDSLDWVDIGNARVINFNANGGDLTLADFRDVVFGGITIINGQSGGKDAVAYEIDGTKTDLGNVGGSPFVIDIPEVNEFSIGNGDSPSQLKNKWSVEGLTVMYSMLTSTNVRDVEAISNPLEFNISPNPSNGIFNVSMEKVQHSTYEVYVFNGAKLLQGSARGSFKIDMSKYKNGLYLLRLETDQGVHTQKIILN